MTIYLKKPCWQQQVTLQGVAKCFIYRKLAPSNRSEKQLFVGNSSVKAHPVCICRTVNFNSNVYAYFSHHS